MATSYDRREALMRFLNGAKNEGETDIIFTSEFLENKNQRAVLGRELLTAIEWNEGKIVTGGWLIRFTGSVNGTLFFRAVPWDRCKDIESDIEGYLESPDARQLVREIIEAIEL